MNKQEFLSLLKQKLSKLPKQEIKERITFYSEMIDDRVEEGLSEEEAVLEIGNIDEIADQIISEVSSNEEPKKKLTQSEIVLLALGSPLWVPLLLAGFIIIWALLITLWAIELPFLIFSYISKYLFIGCKAATKWVYKITKNCFSRIGELF